MADKTIAKASAGTPASKQAMKGKDNVGIPKSMKAKSICTKLSKKSR